MNTSYGQGSLHGFCMRANTLVPCGFYAIIKKWPFIGTKTLKYN